MACYTLGRCKWQQKAVDCSLCFVLCNLQITSCKIALLLPVVYFVLEIASMRWWCPSIICSTSTIPWILIGSVIIVSKSGLLAIETILSLLKLGVALGPAAIPFTALSTLKLFLTLSLSPFAAHHKLLHSKLPSQTPCVLWPLFLIPSLSIRTMIILLFMSVLLNFSCWTSGTLYLFCGISN